MTFKMKYQWKEDLLPVKTKRRSGNRITKVSFITLHDTGNANSTARNNVDYYKRTANEQSASAHVFIDDKEILICIPVEKNPEKAWHVLYNVTTDNKVFGGDANDIAIGVELCYFPNDKQRSLEAYKKYVWFNAYLAYYFKLNPHTSFIGHNKLDPARKTDPTNAVRFIGKTYEQLLQDIVNEYMECITADKPVNIAKTEPKKEEVNLYNPTQKDLLNDTAVVLRRLEEKQKDAIDPKWRLKLLNGELTDSDAIGLIYTALKRGLIQGDMK